MVLITSENILRSKIGKDNDLELKDFSDYSFINKDKPVDDAPIDVTSFVKDFEKFIPSARDIGDGNVTGGWGTTGKFKKGEKVDAEMAEGYLAKDIMKAKKAVKDLVKTPLSRNEEKSLVSLVYNIGRGNFAKSKALEYLNEGDKERFVEEAFSRERGFVNKGSKFEEGLVKRRAAEREMFLKGDVEIDKDEDLTLQTAEEFMYGEDIKRHKNPGIYNAPEEEYSILERGIKKISNILGFDSPLVKDRGISDKAKAQALIQLMATEEGVPMSEYREGPEFVEKFAKGFTDMATLGVMPALEKAMTGEEEFAPDSFEGYAGKGLGAFAGLLFGPAKVGEFVARPIASRIAVTKEMPVGVRMLKQGFKEALTLGPTIAASLVGQAGEEKSFKDSAKVLLGGLESGAVTGAIFGVTRGLFPVEVKHRAARIVIGLTALNAQRALENPGNMVWDRPTHEVIFDTAMDVFFMWRGLGSKDFDKFEKLSELLAENKDLPEGEVEMIIADLRDLQRKASRENNKEVEKELENRNKEPERKEVKPVEVDPEYTFVSKKGNRYEKIGDSWYDSKGELVTNNFVIKAAEKRKETKVESAEVKPTIPEDVEYMGRDTEGKFVYQDKEKKVYYLEEPLVIEDITYHTTDGKALEQIKKEGLKKDTAVSVDEVSADKWKPVKGNIVLRVKGKVKEGTYESTRKLVDQVGPENIEVKTKDGWKSLSEGKDRLKIEQTNIPTHGTDIDMLGGILGKGLREGSAIDFTKDRAWSSESPIQVEVPGVKKGEYVSHNKYYKSSNVVKPSKVIVDLDAYMPEYTGDVLAKIKELEKKHPDVKFEIKGKKPTSDTFNVENLTKVLEEEFDLSHKEAIDMAKDEVKASRNGDPKNMYGYHKGHFHSIGEWKEYFDWLTKEGEKDVKKDIVSDRLKIERTEPKPEPKKETIPEPKTKKVEKEELEFNKKELAKLRKELKEVGEELGKTDANDPRAQELELRQEELLDQIEAYKPKPKTKPEPEPPPEAELEPEPAPRTSFREEDPLKTERNLEVLRPYEKIDNIDTLAARAAAEVNSWLDGNKDVNIRQVKDLVNRLAEDLERFGRGEESPRGIFEYMSLKELEENGRYLRELSDWVDREVGEIGFQDLSEKERIEALKKISDKVDKEREFKLTSGVDPTDLFKSSKKEYKKVIDIFSKEKERLFKSLQGLAEESVDYLTKLEEAELALLRPDIDISFVRRTEDYEVIYKVNSGKFKGREFKVDKAKLPDIPIKDLTLGDIDVRPIIKSYDKEFGKYTGLRLMSGFDPVESIKSLYNLITGKGEVKVLEDKPSEPFSAKEKAKELSRQRGAELGVRSYDTNRFVNYVRNNTSKKQREILPFVIEKTEIPDELGRPDLQKLLARDRETLEPIAKEIKDHFDQGWRMIKANIPNLSVKQIEDYITHIWNIPRHMKASAGNWFITQNRFLERRFIDTYKEGIERGFRPKNLDVTELIKIHDNVSNRAIQNVRYVKSLLELKENGVPLVQRSEKAPISWVEVDYPALTRMVKVKKSQIKKGKGFVTKAKVRVHPDLVRPLKAIFEERFDHPVISAYEAANGVMKKSILSLALFHPGALGEVGIALGMYGKTLNLYFNPVKIYKGLVKGEPDIYKNVKAAKDALENNLQIGASSDIPVNKIQGYLDDLARVTKDTPMAGRMTKFLAGFNSVWDRALWTYLHDSLKLYGYEALVSKLDTNLNLEQTKMRKREIAQMMNDTFGGQNWELLGVTPKEVQMMTWSLLSADWTVSTTRQALSVTGIGKIHKETVGLRKGIGRMFWLRAGLIFGIGMNMLNAAFREWDMKKNPQYYEGQEYSFWDKTMFGNTVGKKTYLFNGRYKDGSERYIRWGKQFRDFFELLRSPIKKLGGKGAPVLQLVSQLFTGHSLSGFKNDDVYGKEGLEWTLGAFKTVGKSAVPISVRRYLREDMEFKALDIVMQSSKGMSRYKAMDYFKKAIVEGDDELLSEVYEGALRNNLPAFTMFNQGLAWAKAEITRELTKDVKDLEEARAKLSLADSPGDKARYGRLVGRLKKEKADKELGLKLYSAALEKAKAFMVVEEGMEEEEKVGISPKLPSVNKFKEIKYK